ncbi:hypothetical protein AVEN_210845-1, partial [Araneus ventricosus]
GDFSLPDSLRQAFFGRTLTCRLGSLPTWSLTVKVEYCFNSLFPETVFSSGPLKSQTFPEGYDIVRLSPTALVLKSGRLALLTPLKPGLLEGCDMGGLSPSLWPVISPTDSEWNTASQLFNPATFLFPKLLYSRAFFRKDKETQIGLPSLGGHLTKLKVECWHNSLSRRLFSSPAPFKAQGLFGRDAGSRLGSPTWVWSFNRLRVEILL